eukprot:scaffold12212_cov122-Isochrysis_galbana.AAC.11
MAECGRGARGVPPPPQHQHPSWPAGGERVGQIDPCDGREAKGAWQPAQMEAGKGLRAYWVA